MSVVLPTPPLVLVMVNLIIDSVPIQVGPRHTESREKCRATPSDSRQAP